MNNKDSEIAPYIALSEIYNAKSHIFRYYLQSASNEYC